MGVGQVCVEYGAVSDRADVDRRALIFVHEQGFMEIIQRRSMMNLSSFSLFRVFSLSSDPLERAIKVHHTKNSPRKRDAWPRRVFFKAAMLEYNTERYGSTKDVVQKLRIKHGV